MAFAGSKKLEVNLFGTCIVRTSGSDSVEITGSKHKALIALLVTAANGRRSRTFLQKTLWAPSHYDSGSQNLRRALSDIKKMLGDLYGEFFLVTNAEVGIDLQRIRFLGRPGAGLFLEGIGIEHVLFQRWQNSIRENPSLIYSVYSIEMPVKSEPAKPTIAILPFPLIVGDPQQAVLGDWLAEQICRSLSRSNLVSVISHLSSRALAKRRIEIGLVRSAFNVDYCVSGSVRVIDGRLILDADLIDAWSGKILLTRTFDYPSEDFLSASSNGIAEIVGAIGRSISNEALAHVTDRPLHDLQFHHMLVAGIGLMHEMTLASFARSREVIRDVIRRFPESAEAHSWLAEWYVMSIFNGWSVDSKADTLKAVKHAEQALEISSDNAFCITTYGVVNNNLLHNAQEAKASFDKAVALNPNQAQAWLSKGVLHAYHDEAKEAVAAVDRARDLSPLDPFAYFYDSLSSTAYLAAENYDRALELANRSLARNKHELSSLRVKISALHHLGRAGDAKIAATELLRRQPGFNLGDYNKNHPAAKYQVGQNMTKALLASGLS